MRLLRPHAIPISVVWRYVGSLCLAGCAAWRADTPQEPSSLPPTKLAAESVVLETITFRLPLGQTDPASIWQHVDEQRIDADARRRLEWNGIRVGVIGSQLPPMFAELLAEEDARKDAPVSHVDHLVTMPQTISRGRGAPFEIVSPERHAELTSLRRTANGQLVCESLTNSQCVLIVKPYPRDDSRVELSLEPVIRHGQPTQRFLASDGDSVMKSVSGDNHHFPELCWKSELSPGESLLLTCSDESRGLGQAFFTDATQGDRRQRWVVIRLAQTQRDNLFPLGMPPTRAPLDRALLDPEMAP